MRTFSNKNVSISFLRILLNLCCCLFAFPTKNQYALPIASVSFQKTINTTQDYPKLYFKSSVPSPLLSNTLTVSEEARRQLSVGAELSTPNTKSASP